MELVDRPGAATFSNMEYLDQKRVNLHLRDAAGRADRRLLRPAEESRTQGYAIARLRSRRATAPADLVKLDILVNGEPVDALSLIIHRTRPYRAGSALVESLQAS